MPLIAHQSKNPQQITGPTKGLNTSSTSQGKLQPFVAEGSEAVVTGATSRGAEEAEGREGWTTARLTGSRRLKMASAGSLGMELPGGTRIPSISRRRKGRRWRTTGLTRQTHRRPLAVTNPRAHRHPILLDPPWRKTNSGGRKRQLRRNLHLRKRSYATRMTRNETSLISHDQNHRRRKTAARRIRPTPVPKRPLERQTGGDGGAAGKQLG